MPGMFSLCMSTLLSIPLVGSPRLLPTRLQASECLFLWTPQGIDMRITVPALKEFTLIRDQARRRSVCAQSTAVSWKEQRRVHEDGTHSTSRVRFGGREGEEERWEGTEAWRTSPVWLAREYSSEAVCKAKLLISQKKRFLILVGKAGVWEDGNPQRLCAEKQTGAVLRTSVQAWVGWMTGERIWSSESLTCQTQCHVQAFPIETNIFTRHAQNHSSVYICEDFGRKKKKRGLNRYF